MRRGSLRAVVAASIALLLVGLGPAAVGADQRTVGKRQSSILVVVQRAKMIDNAFRPKSITIAKGTKVRWTNRGSAVHSTTSNTGLWDSGLLSPGDSFARVFRKAGTFKYHCTVHPAVMKGIITVK